MGNHSNSTLLARFRFNITKNVSSMFKKYFITDVWQTVLAEANVSY